MRKGKRLIAWIMAVVMLFTICVFGGNGTAEAAATTPVAKHGRLSVKGADLVDSKGNKFQLRGISTHGINWDVGSPYVNKKAFKTLRDDWGVNAIRLAMYTEEYNGYCSGGSQAKLRKLVDKGVGYATDLGMYAIIDWHILSDGNPNKNKAQAKKFFTTMAKKYKNNKNVIYEICNEPNGCGWKEIKSYATDIIKTIRKYDKKAVIIVGTPPGHSLERMECQMKLQTAQSRDIRISCTPCISTQVSGRTMNIFRQRLLMQERRSFRSLYLSLVYHRPVATEPLTRHPQTNG